MNDFINHADNDGDSPHSCNTCGALIHPDGSAPDCTGECSRYTHEPNSEQELNFNDNEQLSLDIDFYPEDEEYYDDGC